MRAMSLAYPDDPAWDTQLTQYMLGDFFLVSVFADQVRLPAIAMCDLVFEIHWPGGLRQYAPGLER